VYYTGPPAVLDASCEVPITADLGRLSLEESFSYALSTDCRKALASSSKAAACGDVHRDIEKSLRLGAATKVQWSNWLLEAWSRNAGDIPCTDLIASIESNHLYSVP
jgi:hypothetical protein